MLANVHTINYYIHRLWDCFVTNKFCVVLSSLFLEMIFHRTAWKYINKISRQSYQHISSSKYKICLKKILKIREKHRKNAWKLLKLKKSLEKYSKNGEKNEKSLEKYSKFVGKYEIRLKSLKKREKSTKRKKSTKFDEFVQVFGKISKNHSWKAL